MAFQIKSFLSIVASMVNRMRLTTTRINDFNVGSVARVLVEAVAQEQEEIYREVLNAVTEAIPVATFTSFNFGLLGAVAASGTYTLTIMPQLTATVIPGGSTVTSSDGSRVYATTADATIPAGQATCTLSVVCTVAGSAGNLAPGDSGLLAPMPIGFVSCIDLAGISGGADQETEAQRLTRFQSYVSSLARSPVAGIIYGATTAALTNASGAIIERCVAAAVIEPWKTDTSQNPAYIQVYVWNGVGNTSSTLVSQVAQVLTGYLDASGNPVPGWIAAGTRMDVFAAPQQALTVTGTVTSAPGYVHANVVAAVSAAQAAYVATFGPGSPALVAKLSQLAMDTPGVVNYELSAPTADTTPAASTVLYPVTLNNA